MGKKDKKKGKGAEKTAAKTEKKLSQKLKKELAAKGEEDIDSLIAKFVEEDKAKEAVTEDLVPPPSKRSAFSLTPHPEKEQLIMFGGEYFNGNECSMFNDLLFYNIKQNKWLKVNSPRGPTPRSAHQAVALAQGGGQLWVFGGEFTSKSQSQFHHFKDLWVFHLKTKKWEKINTTGGPSARSGHRMVALKKTLMVFGGFHDNGFNCKYFNDVHAFDLENYKWKTLEITGNGPCPRSACQMVTTPEGQLLVYGGYSKEKVKKDVDKGVTHTDMYLLTPDKRDESGSKWKWQSVKQAGVRPNPRCGFSMVAGSAGDKAFLFGGVHDEVDEEEELEGVFYNDMYQLDLAKPTWHQVEITGKKDPSKKKRRKKDGEEEEDEDMENKLENMTVEDKNEKLVSDDGVFTVTVGPSQSDSKKSRGSEDDDDEDDVFQPPPRINAGLAVRRNTLYLYGGLYEDGDKQLTLNDFYTLDLNKLEEWQTIIPLNKDDMEWFESDDDDDDDMDDDSDDDDEDDMDTD